VRLIDTAAELSALAERLATLSPHSRVDWSDSWTDEDMRDFMAESLRRPEAEESEESHLKPGDVVVSVLVGAVETKVRPAVLIASDTYLVERPDVLVGILTTKVPKTNTSTDCVLMDWQLAGLRAESFFRAYILTIHRSELTVIGHLSSRDWSQVRTCVRASFAL
jgi:hypothetical protein